jgi:tRNA A-37 threonylcarbamoyl transferase component Bud32
MDPNIRREFEQEVSDRDYPELVEFLRANGLLIDRIESLTRGSRDYFLFLHLNSAGREQLGLAGDELLAIVLHQSQQQAWFFQEIRKKLRAYDRLAKTAVLVISADTRIVQACAGAYPDSETGYKTAYVGITHGDIRSIGRAEESREFLGSAFAEQAFVVDHFDTRFPVPDDLFGRMALLNQLEHDVVQGELGVAILGIRRVGKTSVLKRLIAQVANQPGQEWITALYDAQEHTVDADAHNAARSLLREVRSAATLAGMQLQRNDTDDPLSNLRSQIKWLVERQQRRVLLAVDEVEWLVPTNDASDPAERARREKEFVRLFGAFRALKQAYPSNVGLVVCGINETFCEMSDIGGNNNPALDLFQTHYVPLLERSDMDDVLRTIGARMSVALQPEFADMLWSAFGGHAYLSRQFCSSVVRRTKTRPLVLKGEDFQSDYRAFVDRRADAVIKQVVQHLAKFYPNDYYTLHRAARGEATSEDDASVRHLRAYGLLTEGSPPRLTMEALRQFAEKHGVDEVRVGRFSLLQRLGDGATGVVWRAWDRQVGEQRALKIYHSSVTREYAESEMRNLRALACDVVPQAFEVADYEDRFALVMEYVPGRTMTGVIREFKDGVPPETLSQLTASLLAAVEALHPSDERRRSLKKQMQERSQVSEEEFAEYFRLCESGYLHRDLKPDNVIVSDEKLWTVRLIDVQLAKRPDEANLTRVGTPAYAPADWGIAKWDVSFDLYAVGVIFHELMFGKQPGVGDPIAEIRDKTPDSKYARAVASFYERALAQAAAERFHSVEEMRAAWEDVLTSPS